MDLGESQSSSSHTQGESEGPCLIVQDSQKEDVVPGTSHKQKMLWEMTALQGDQTISPVLEQIRQEKNAGQDKDSKKKESPVGTSSSSTEAPPWTITKMPSVPPRHKESHTSSSSSSAGSVYPCSSHDTSSTRSSLPSLASSSSTSSGSANLRKPKQIGFKAKRPVEEHVQPAPEKDTSDEHISPSQEDMFSDSKTEEVREVTRHPLIGTPSETIPSLQLSGQIIYANDTSTSEGSISIIPPSPEAWGPVPVVIPSTPTPDEEEPMDVSLENSDGDVQTQPLVVGETQDLTSLSQPQQAGEQQVESVKKKTSQSRTSQSRRKQKDGGSEGSDEDDIRIPEWQQALNREEEAAAAAAQSGSSHSSGRASKGASSSENSTQSDKWRSQSESLAGQNVQEGIITTDESARSKPGSAKSPVLQGSTEKGSATGANVEPMRRSQRSQQSASRAKDLEPTEPQFSQDLFHPDVPADTEASEPVEIISQQTQERQAIGSQKPQSSQPQATTTPDKPDKPPSDDWVLRLTPSQSETQSQGVYLIGKVPGSQSSSQKGQKDTKESGQVEHVAETSPQKPLGSQKQTPSREKQHEEEEEDSVKPHSEVHETSRASEGSPWDANISSVPKQSESVDPSQSSSIGFHLSVPTDSGLRPVTSVTPPVEKTKKKRHVTRQPRHSTPIMEEDTQNKEHEESTPTGVKVQQATSTLTLEEGMESQQQDSNDLPRFRLEKPSDTEQLVKTAKESPSKKSTSVFSRVQEVKAATVPRRARKQIYSAGGNSGESDDPFALPPNVTRSRQQDSVAGKPEEVESAVDPAGQEEPNPQPEKAEEEDEATIPMVYDEITVATKPAVVAQSEVVKPGKSKKRGKKGGGGGKKRKKPTQSQSGDSSKNEPADATSSVTHHKSKHPRVERDPYEWTESQSNKTPSPLKLRRDVDTDTAVILPRRRLNEPSEPEQNIGDEGGAGTSGAREAAGGDDGKGKEGGQDTTPSKETGQRGQDTSPSKQQTPPVEDDDQDRSHDRSGSGGDSDRSLRQYPRNVGITRQIKTVIIRRLLVTKIIEEKVFKDGNLIDSNTQTIEDEPLVERQVDEQFSPSFGSSASNSLSSGSLADISSLSSSKSSSGTPSLLKSSSSSSGLSNVTKSSTISSISQIDSSIGKTVASSPGSNKTSPNTPKMGRSVSFQDEQPGQKSPAEEPLPSRSPDRSTRKSTLARSQTEPSSPTRQTSVLTRSSTDVTPTHKEGGEGKESTGKKSIFAKTYGTPGKRGLRARSSEDKDRHKERGRKEKLVAERSKDTDGEDDGHQRPQRRQRRSRSGQKSGSRSPMNRRPDEEPSAPTTLPTSPLRPTLPQAEGRSLPSESTSGPSASLSKSSSSKASEILAEPPQDPESPGTESHQLKPGVRVIAKWLDNYYYAGTIVDPTTDNKHTVLFDDGDTRNIAEKNIIIKEWLSRGQSVLASRDDGFSYAGIVVGYYNDQESGEQGYVVETDNDQETRRYSRGKVILTRDQAAVLVVSSSGSGASSSEINLDNIVSGKRSRSRFVLSPGGSPRGRAKREADKVQSPLASTSSHPSTKRKLLSAERPGDRSSSPSPKRGKGMKGELVSDVPVSPRRSPRKNPAAPVSSSPLTSRFPSLQDRMRVMGPLPTNKSLFKGLAFLITQGTEQKKRKLFGMSPASSTDSSGVEEETEVSPIDKNYAQEQIERGGGSVLANFDKSQITKCKVYLISNTFSRTTKYFQALAAGIPCLSHMWLRDCINSDRILTYQAYLLPAGIGLDDKTILEQQPQLSPHILLDLHIYVVSNKKTGNQDAWRSVLIASGCNVVKKLPTQLQRQGMAFDCNLIITDHTCPKHIIEKALQLGIPVVGQEWLMQSLINSNRFPYKASYKFAWDWRDPSSF